MALAHKGLAFERVPVPFTDVPTVEGSVSKTVPVIRDGDRVVADSFDIALYLDETYPDRPTLFGGPGGAGDGALHRALVAGHDPSLSRLGGTRWTFTTAWRRPTRPISGRAAKARFGKRLEEVPAAREAGLDAFRASLAPLRSMLGYQPFIGGDVAAVCRLHRLRRLPVGARHLAVRAAGSRRSGRSTGSSAASTCTAASGAACEAA